MNIIWSTQPKTISLYHFYFYHSQAFVIHHSMPEMPKLWLLHCLSRMSSLNQAFPPSLADLMVPPKWIGRPRWFSIYRWSLGVAHVLQTSGTQRFRQHPHFSVDWSKIFFFMLVLWALLDWFHSISWFFWFLGFSCFNDHTGWVSLSQVGWALLGLGSGCRGRSTFWEPGRSGG